MLEEEEFGYEDEEILENIPVHGVAENEQGNPGTFESRDSDYLS